MTNRYGYLRKNVSLTFHIDETPPPESHSSDGIAHPWLLNS